MRSPRDLRPNNPAHRRRGRQGIEKPSPAERPDNPRYCPSREGKTNLTGYFDWEVKLQPLATEQSRARGKRVTLQDLHAKMINDCFAKYGKPEIASVNRREGQG